MSEDNSKSRFMVDIPDLEVEVVPADVAKSLGPKGIYDMVVDLDDEGARWELTLLLHKHFKEEYERALVEAPELAALSEDQLWEALDSEPREPGVGEAVQ